MVRRFSTVMFSVAGTFFLAGVVVGRGGETPAADIQKLNRLTGSGPMTGALKEMQADAARTKKLLAAALPLAKESGKLSFNGAMVLALAAADLKDLKSSEAFFRVCIDQAVKLQSANKLLQAYGPLIDIYFDSKQYDQSARLCRELLELKTDDGKERIVLVPFKNRFGEIIFEEFDRFDTAGRLRPGVHRILIQAVAKSGDYKQALKLVDSLIKAQDHWMERQLRGWVLREAGQEDEAAKVYEEVIAGIAKDKDLDPDERERYLERYQMTLSNLYVDMKKIDKATGILQELLKRNPDSPGLNNDLGYIWADNDMNLDEAEKLIRKALVLDEKRRKAAGLPPELDRDNGAYLDSLAWVLFKKKQYKEAKDVLLKAIEDENSQHIEIYDHLGDVYIALDQPDHAIKAWRKGLEVVGEGRREAERKALVEKKIQKHKK
ncbi:MAG: tetratricopeptide repeat protein [Gemmataceae bacterium]|nr:tetratricopeptide repeat protein [Gemmataceae bacterium]